MAHSKLDGKSFKNLFIAGSRRLDDGKEYLDSINVFPVPDGDTGSNMADTVNNAVSALAEVDEEELPIVLETLSKRLRMEAKGNSGIILSEFFHGMFLILKDRDHVDTGSFVMAMTNGKDAAYAAIADPKEGTILTVIRKMVDRLSQTQDDLEDMKHALEKVVESGKIALEETTDEMPLLKENHVVDSGAHGFLLFWEGALMYLKGEFAHVKLAPIKKIFKTDQADKITYRFCTEGLVKVKEFDRADLKSKLKELGDSLIISGNGGASDLLKIHIHTNEPDTVFGHLSDIGELVKTKAEDMIEQNRKRTGSAPKQKVAIVTDSTSDLELDFREELGVEMAPLMVMFGEKSYRDRVDITAEEFYELMPTFDGIARTSLPQASEFLRAYEAAAQMGESILGIYVSSKISGTWQAGKKWGDDFEECDVVAYDSNFASLGVGLMVREAATMAKGGADMESIIARLDEIKSKMSLLLTVDTLDYLAKNGRIGSAKKIFGKTLGVRPLLSFTDGEVASLSTGFGSSGVRAKLMKELKVVSSRLDFEGNFGVVWSGSEEARDRMIESIKGAMKVNYLYVAMASPVVGAHTGPGALGVACY